MAKGDDQAVFFLIRGADHSNTLIMDSEHNFSEIAQVR